MTAKLIEKDVSESSLEAVVCMCAFHSIAMVAETGNAFSFTDNRMGGLLSQSFIERGEAD